MRFLALLSSFRGSASSGAVAGDARRLRIMSTQSFSRSRLVLCKVMSGFQLISQLHSSLRAPLALLHTQRSAFDDGFIAPLRELQSIIARNGFTHTPQAELVAYAAHENASPSFSQWLEAYLRDTGVKRLQRCVASLRDSGTLACSSMSLICSNIVYVLTEMRAWAVSGEYIDIGLQPTLLTAAVEKGTELLHQLEQLQNGLTLHCSGARALALFLSNAFKLLADSSTHNADFPSAVCKEALQFVHARLWCKEILDVMGSNAAADTSSSIGGNGIFNSGAFNSAPAATSAAPHPPQHACIERACAALNAACTACSAAVGQSVIASIRPAFAVDFPQRKACNGDDVFAVEAEGQEFGVVMMSLGGGAGAAPSHSLEFARVAEDAESGWVLEQAEAALSLKVSDA
jgi:hypothetical protein